MPLEGSAAPARPEGLHAYRVSNPFELAEFVLGWMRKWGWADVEGWADKTRDHVVEMAAQFGRLDPTGGLRVVLVGARECLTQIWWELENGVARIPASLVIPHVDKTTGEMKASKLECACRLALAHFEKSDAQVADGRKALDSYRFRGENKSRKVNGEVVKWQRPQIFPVAGAWWWGTAFDDRCRASELATNPAPARAASHNAELELDTLPATNLAGYRRRARQSPPPGLTGRFGRDYHTDDDHPMLVSRMRELLKADLEQLAAELVVATWCPAIAMRVAPPSHPLLSASLPRRSILAGGPAADVDWSRARQAIRAGGASDIA